MKQQIVIAVSAIIFISLLIIFVLVSQRSSEELPHKEEPGIHQRLEMDANGDKKISREEWMHHFNRIFESIDTNNDNGTTINEIRNHIKILHKKRRPSHFPPAEIFIQKFDTNNDSIISKTEWDNHHKMLFNNFDINNDGYNDKNEHLPIPRRKGEGPPAGRPREF